MATSEFPNLTVHLASQTLKMSHHTEETVAAGSGSSSGTSRRFKVRQVLVTVTRTRARNQDGTFLTETAGLPRSVAEGIPGAAPQTDTGLLASAFAQHARVQAARLAALQDQLLSGA